MAALLILATVGKGGRNILSDVKTVQTRLKAHGVDPGRIDGIAGAKTIAAITKFQTGFLSRPDGLVEPGGMTWGYLKKAPGTLPKPGTKAPATTKPASEWEGDPAKWTQEKKLASLESSTRTKVSTVLTNLRTAGFRPKVFYGWRSVKIQEELYKKGVTKVLFSFHNAQKPDGTPNAYAADIIDERWGWDAAAEKNGFWKALGKEAKAAGLVWGGDWKDFPDVAHVQNKQNSELAAVKKESGL